ncbi:MAG TPA: hypothetical protein VJ810_26615 [Blastocatellia bacterium]|nr:hypothetical protein [Blastocatellia bacterium]
MSNQKQTINNSNLSDLTVADDQQSQIKGGPTPKSKRDLLLKSSVAEPSSGLGDLEPTAEVKGGGWGYGESTVKLNHNQTMARVSGDEDKTRTAKLAGLAALEDLEPYGDVFGGAAAVIKS